MSTTIQISDSLRRELKVLASYQDLSYDELLQDLVSVFNTAIPFNTEEEFSEWFEDNIEKFGFTEVIERRKRSSPDYRLRDRDDEIQEVELELIGSHFRHHGHDPEETDLIICLFSEEDRIKGVPVLSIVNDEALEKEVIEREEHNHTSLSIPRQLRDDINHLINDTGFQNPSEFTTFVLRQILSEGEFESAEDYSASVEHVRKRLQRLGYIDKDDGDM